MNDMLLQLGRNPQARKVFLALGLPVKLPRDLARGSGPDTAAPLAGKRVLVAGAGPAEAVEHVRGIAEAAGADVTVGESPHGLLYDARTLAGPADLRGLYDFLHPRVRTVSACGRVVIVGRDPGGAATPAAAAAAQALEGVVRSLGKELGGKGTTVNLVRVGEGADDRLAGPLRFLLSARSAFVSGQVIGVSAVAAAPSDVPLSGGLRGKVAVVTGAARGIGAAIADRLAEEGAKVVGVDLPSAGDELAGRMEALGGAALGLDLTAADAATRLADYLAEHDGGLDVMVHNAGITRDRTLGKMSEQWWDQCIAINIGAVLRVNEVLLERALLREGGRMVCMASIAGVGGNPGQTNYAAAKAGLIGYVARLAPELAARAITANAVAPGFIETRMTAAIPMMTRELARRLNSLGQGGQPGDIADVVAFLASPAAFGITGTTVRACGQHLAGA